MPRRLDIHSPTVVLYDGECPFCAQYIRTMRLRQAIPGIELRDARTVNLDDYLDTQRYNLDEGMAVIHGGTVYHGADAMHFFALTSTGNGVVNRLNAVLFRHQAVARRLYPLCRAMRGLALKIKGVPPLHPTGKSS